MNSAGGTNTGRKTDRLGCSSRRHRNVGDGKDSNRPDRGEPGDGEAPGGIRDGMPVDPTRFNTATAFLIRSKFEDGQELEIRHDQGNGILFEGTKGRIFVNCGRLTGQPVEDLTSNPLPGTRFAMSTKGRNPRTTFATSLNRSSQKESRFRMFSAIIALFNLPFGRHRGKIKAPHSLEPQERNCYR